MRRSRTVVGSDFGVLKCVHVLSVRARVGGCDLRTLKINTDTFDI